MRSRFILDGLTPKVIEKVGRSESICECKYLPQRHITEGLRHRREYECSNPTSQTLGTLCERPCEFYS